MGCVGDCFVALCAPRNDMKLSGLDDGNLFRGEVVELVDEGVDGAVGGGDVAGEALLLPRGGGGAFVQGK